MSSPLFPMYLTTDIQKEPENTILINNPSEMMTPAIMDRVEEPYIKASIITKSDCRGGDDTMYWEKSEIVNQSFNIDIELIFNMPLAEVVFDFYDRLKSISKGYASFLIITRLASVHQNW